MNKVFNKLLMISFIQNSEEKAENYSHKLSELFWKTVQYNWDEDDNKEIACFKKTCIFLWHFKLGYEIL